MTAPSSPPPASPAVQVFVDAQVWMEARLQHLDALAQDQGMTWTQVRALRALSALGSCSHRTLAAALGRNASNVTALVDQLEADGLVVREMEPSDRRTRRLTLTDRGTERLVKVLAEAEVALVTPAGAAVQASDLELLGVVDALELLLVRAAQAGLVGAPRSDTRS